MEQKPENPHKIGISANLVSASSCQFWVNDARTSPYGDTPVTQNGSGNVLARARPWAPARSGLAWAQGLRKRPMTTSPNRRPADQLARIRQRIAELRAQEAELRQGFLSGALDPIGDDYTVAIQRRVNERIDLR